MAGNDVLLDDFVEQEESSIMVSQKQESSKWTNEKHSLYLKWIEASFVDQLYNSLDTQNTRSFDLHSTCKNYCTNCIPSGQFKVLKHGSWSKKCFKNKNSKLKDIDRPHVCPCNPWIQHFSNGSHKRPSSTALQEPGCSDTEVTDQNFVEDSRKKTRTSNIVQSGDDQVVPHSTSDATEIPDSYEPSKK